MQIEITRGKLVIEGSGEEWEEMRRSIKPAILICAPANELRFAINIILQQE